MILITGTSNRLWPKEVHSGMWFINYIPRRFDSMLHFKKPMARGVFPWEAYFYGYENLYLCDGGKKYFTATAEINKSHIRYFILIGLSSILSIFSLTVGFITPSIFLALRKAPKIAK